MMSGNHCYELPFLWSVPQAAWPMFLKHASLLCVRCCHCQEHLSPVLPPRFSSSILARRHSWVESSRECGHGAGFRMDSEHPLGGWVIPAPATISAEDVGLRDVSPRNMKSSGLIRGWLPGRETDTYTAVGQGCSWSLEDMHGQFQ